MLVGLSAERPGGPDTNRLVGMNGCGGYVKSLASVAANADTNVFYL